MSKFILELQAIKKCFGRVSALDDFHFSVEPGEWVSIMGPSGSGKTTLLNILACLDAPTSGDYFLDGINTASFNENQRTVIRREKIGLVFQQFHLIPYLTALENILLAQYYHSMIDEEEAKAVLARIGLINRATHLPSQLSGGEQQRVCVARALINQPALILADEPTGNLDEENEAIVLEFFKDLHRQGKTIILVTHNPEIGREGDRVIYLHHGKIVDSESVSGITLPVLPVLPVKAKTCS